LRKIKERRGSRRRSSRCLIGKSICIFARIQRRRGATKEALDRATLSLFMSH
jgi:hypothetical protein